MTSPSSHDSSNLPPDGKPSPEAAAALPSKQTGDESQNAERKSEEPRPGESASANSDEEQQESEPCEPGSTNIAPGEDADSKSLIDSIDTDSRSSSNLTQPTLEDATDDSAPLTYSTGERGGELDTVLKVPSSNIPPTANEEEVSPPIINRASVPLAEANMTESEVRFRLFPRESGLPHTSPLPETSGLVLGHFRIEERIGHGGMGAVFRAIDERLQRVVALKVLSPSQLHQPDAIQRFRNEARSAARLDHVNIARVFYFGEEKGVHFIVYEFVDGANIRDLIHNEGRLKPTEAVYYTHQVAAALNHTSAAGVIHRDIKPSNIIVTPTGVAKLVDLGLARQESTESHGDLTVAGTTLGTFDYISPEQAKDPRFVDVRSDIYSLGCSIYHMLTGEPPYPGGSVMKKLLDHQDKYVPNPSDKVPNLPPLLSTVVMKMMASDPADRYRTPDELLNDLEDVASILGMPGAHPRNLRRGTTASPAQRHWESWLSWGAMAILLIAIVVGIDLAPEMIDASPSEPVTTTPAETNDNNKPAPVEKNSEVPSPANPSQQVATNEIPGELNITSPDDIPDDATSDIKPAKTNSNPPAVSTLTNPGPSVNQFVLKNSGGEDQSFASLEEACRLAPTNGLIDVLGNGSQPIVVDQPVQLLKKSITLRAAPGTRPQIQFRYSTRRPSSFSGLIDLSNFSSLSLLNLDVEFQIDPQVTDVTPTLIALLGDGNSLLLKNCRINVLNDSAQSSSLIQVREAEKFERIIVDPMLSRADSEIEINRSFLHGSSRIFQVDVAVPATLTVSESVLASASETIYLESSLLPVSFPALEPVSDEPPHTVELNFNLSTIACGNSFLTLNRTLKDQSLMPFIKVTTSENVIVSKPAGLTLVQTNFSETAINYDLGTVTPRRLLWNEKMGADYFSGFGSYYANDYGDQEPPVQPTPTSNIEGWRNLWKNTTERSLTSREVPNALPRIGSDTTSFTELTLEDFQLQGEAGPNSPVQGSSDGQRNAGAPIDDLLRLMPPAAPKSTTNRTAPAS